MTSSATATGAAPYEPADLVTLARWWQAAPADEWWRLVLEFLNEYGHAPVEQRALLLAEEPAEAGDPRWDVLLAALAEHLAARDGRAAPDWAEHRTLGTFWFPFSSPGARADAVVHAPSAFRRRGVFVAARELEVV